MADEHGNKPIDQSVSRDWAGGGFRERGPHYDDAPRYEGGYKRSDQFVREMNRGVDFDRGQEFYGHEGSHGRGQPSGVDIRREDVPDGARAPIRHIPKNYKRTDERIWEAVCERLFESGLNVRDVAVDVSDATVTLQGTVPDRRTKHGIEDCAAGCMGVEDVDNRIRVRPGEPAPST